MAGTGAGGGWDNGNWGAPPPPPPPPQWAPPSPQWYAPAPKRTNPWVIVAAVAGALVLFIGFCVAVVVVVNNNENKQDAAKDRVAHAAPPPDYPTLFAGPTAGYAQLPDTFSGSGALTEARIVAGAAPGHGVNVQVGLRNSAFVDGYERQWRLPSRAAGYSVVIFRFGDVRGATHYAALNIAGAERADNVSLVPGVNTSIRSGTELDEAGMYWDLAVTQMGDFVVLVRHWSENPTPQRTVLLDVTKRTLARMP